MKASPRLRHLRSLTLTATSALALLACSSSSPSGGTGGSSGTATGGSNATGTGGSNTTGSGGSNSTGSGGRNTGSGGTVATGGNTGSGGTGTGGSNTTGSGGSSGGSGGSNAGSGGSSGGHGGANNGGSGGANNGGHGGANNGSGGSATGSGGTTGSGGAASGFCPSGAIFCADFEEANGVPSNSPVGTAAFSDPSEYGMTFGGSMAVMGLDKTGPYAGSQSMKVYPSSSFSVRTLAVAVPQKFWVRLYIKSDKAIGQPDHNSFFGAGVDPDYSKGHFVEVSEQFSCILLNANDALYPAGTTCGTNSALTANDWHCMAAQFDGTTGNVQVFAGTTKIIDAVGWASAKQAFTTFSFGYFAYNPNSATVWYDNVVVSPNPLSCP